VTHHLTIIAGTDAGLSEAFSQWAEADLMDATAFVDLGDASVGLDTPVLWARSGSTVRSTLEEVLTSEMWPAVSFVSVRTGQLGSVENSSITAEAAILDAVRSSFLGDCDFRAFTVGIAEPDGSFGANLFDPNWDLHLLHDPILIADADVAVLPIRDRDRPSTCLLTALLVAGGFRWQGEPLIDLHDDPAGLVVPARIIRAQLRVVNAGKFIDDVLVGAFPESGPWTVPSGVSAIGDRTGSTIDRALADSIGSAVGFEFRPFQPPRLPAPDQIGILAGLKLFTRNFVAAARKAPVLVIDRFTTNIGEGIAAAAQQLTFGDQSSVVMRFRPGLSSGDTDDLLTRLQEVGMPDTGSPAIPDPHPWTLLCDASFGLIDGGDLPDGVPTPMRDTQRLLYLNPTAIGPAPDDAGFDVSSLEVELLGLDQDLEHIKPMDIENARALDNALTQVSLADQTTSSDSGAAQGSSTIRSTVENDDDDDDDDDDRESGPEIHRRDHPDFDPSSYQPLAAFYQGPAPQTPDDYKTNQILHQEALREHDPICGPWKAENRCDHCGTSFHHGVCYLHEPSGELVHIGHICAKNSSLQLPEQDPSQLIIQSLQDRWQRWLVSRRNCLLWQIGTYLAAATDNAREGLATGMAEREAPDRSTEDVEMAQAKLRLATIRSMAASLLAGAATIASFFFVFIPLLLVLVLFGGAILALITRGTLLTRELARVQTRQAAGHRTRQIALLKIQHSSTELARLVNARSQFSDWQAMIRTVVHRPYSRLDSTDTGESTPNTVSRPQSYVHGTADPTQQQLRAVQRHALQMTFHSGWLKTVFLEMKQRWQTDYSEDVLWAGEHAPEPESDNSPPGAVRAHIPGTNEPVYSPREDFRSRMLGGQLQPAVIAVLTDEIVEWLSDRSLDELLSPVSVVGPGRALNGQPPEAFLRGLAIPLEEIPMFQPQVFGTDPDALHLRLNNLDSSHPADSDASPLIDPETVSPGRDLVFASFRVVLSPPISPDWLAGYKGTSGGPSSGSPGGDTTDGPTDGPTDDTYPVV